MQYNNKSSLRRVSIFQILIKLKIGKQINQNIFYQMKINLNLTILLSICIFTTSALHLKHQPIYQPQKYENSLQNIQDSFKTDLLKIRSIYANIDRTLQQSVSPNEQLSTLQEGLADQRDVLYNIQSYLNLPYNQRKCECFNLTLESKIQIADQISLVSLSLDQMEQKNRCDGCEQILQVKQLIKQQRNYLTIMQDTINSKCCEVLQTIYVDNLQGSNWKYGGYSPEQYQAFVSSYVQSKGSKIIKQKCSSKVPFVNMQTNKCIACYSEPIFNLKDRQCENCPIGKNFNFVTRSCDYNRTCPVDTKFSQSTLVCQKIRPAINSSSCPPDQPIYNPDDFACHKCPSEAPSFDEATGECSQCPKDYVWDSIKSKCIHISCKKGEQYIVSLQRCMPQKISSTNDDGSSSLCPPQMPFWDKISKSCTLCPTQTPFFNKTQKKCQNCPTQSQWSYTLNKCVRDCEEGTQLNIQTYECEQIRQPKPQSKPQPQNPDEEGDIAICPPNKPIWNRQSKSCQLCPSYKPHWNSKTKQCLACSSGQKWNSDLEECQDQVQIPTCSEYQQYDPETHSCKDKPETSDEVIALCPPSNPYYNSNSLSCQKCPQQRPFYNETQKKCMQPQTQARPEPEPECQQNQRYNPIAKRCENKIESSYNKTGGNIASCPPETPFWDSDSLKCIQCEKGKAYNEQKDKCIECETENCELENMKCEEGFELNRETLECEKCETWELFNKETKKCDKICEQGQYYSVEERVCHGTISFCSPGLVYNKDRLWCECEEGRNYKYNEQLKKCEAVCKQTQIYNVLDDFCQ